MVVYGNVWQFFYCKPWYFIGVLSNVALSLYPFPLLFGVILSLSSKLLLIKEPLIPEWVIMKARYHTEIISYSVSHAYGWHSPKLLLHWKPEDKFVLSWILIPVSRAFFNVFTSFQSTVRWYCYYGLLTMNNPQNWSLIFLLGGWFGNITITNVLYFLLSQEQKCQEEYSIMVSLIHFFIICLVHLLYPNKTLDGSWHSLIWI